MKVNAQHAARSIDSLFTTLVHNYEFNGNVLISEGNKVIFKHSFGYADAEHKVTNNNETAFHLASVSKTFTAVAVLQLMQKGKLKLDDCFIKYFPDFPFPQITIRQLLSHTSGLPDYQIFEEPYRKDPSAMFTINDLLPAFRHYKRGLLFQPGDKFSYSNTGYGLLALLVEQLSKMPFPHYLSEYIFTPAKMTHTYIESPQIKVPDQNRARRYEYSGYDPEKLTIIDSAKAAHIDAYVVGGILGPTGVVSTLQDLFRFDQALYNNKLIKKSVLDEAFTPTILNDGSKATTGWQNTRSYYGLGWEILCDTTYGRVVWHGGGSAGIVTLFLRNITRHQTVIVLDNVTHRGLHVQALNAYYLLNNGPLYYEKKSLAQLYVKELYSKGAEAASVAFNQYRSDTAHYYLNEWELNRYGYELLGDGHLTEALEVFKVNCFLFPTAFNVYDSYADVLKRAGKKKEAIRMYQKSIELNPDNTNGKKALDLLLRSSFTE